MALILSRELGLLVIRAIVSLRTIYRHELSTKRKSLFQAGNLSQRFRLMAQHHRCKYELVLIERI
jgi:hypothetical protein